MPQSDYVIRVYDPWTGELRATITNWRTFFLERKLNYYDTLRLGLSEDSPSVQYFVLDAILEIWRKIDRPGAQWYLETTLLHRTEQHDFTEDQHRIFTSYSRGLLDLVHRRNIEYYSTTAFTLKSAPGETVIKEFVDENCGPRANSVERLSHNIWNAVIPGLSIEPNQGRGPIWKGARAWQNVLDVIDEVSTATDVDFDILRISPTGFEFRCYYPQRGTDRSQYIIFAPELANMTNVTYTKSRTEESNAIVVGGQGEGEDRQVYRTYDPTSADDSPWNLIEANRDGRSQPTLDSLKTEADTAIKELATQESYNFKVLQTDSRQYGSEYFLGDRVRARYNNVETTKKIIGVSFNVADNVEEIDLEFADFPAR